MDILGAISSRLFGREVKKIYIKDHLLWICIILDAQHILANISSH
jgi:hypothetical protein